MLTTAKELLMNRHFDVGVAKVLTCSWPKLELKLLNLPVS